MNFNRSCVRIVGTEDIIRNFIIAPSLKRLEDGSYTLSWFDFYSSLVSKDEEVPENIRVEEYYISGELSGQRSSVFFPQYGRIGFLNMSTWNGGITMYKIRNEWFIDSGKRLIVESAELITDPFWKIRAREGKAPIPAASSYTSSGLSVVQKDIVLRRYWDELCGVDKHIIWSGSSMEKKYGDLKDLKEVYYDL